jgi:hypothetical protein
MTSGEPTDDSRLERIEKRLTRLEDTVSALQDVVETIRDSRSPDGEEAERSTGPSATGGNATVASSEEVPPQSDPEMPQEQELLQEQESPQEQESTQDLGASIGPGGEGASRPDGEASSASDKRERAAAGGPLQRYKAILGLRGVDWISYVGIGLLLFGIAFLFKYSIDQGWITPEVRIGIGAATGASLLLAGMRRADGRPLLQQILFGGSVATSYGTVFAAYQLYGLLAYPAAFGAMILITTVSVALGLQQDYVSMAFIGTAGGLGTPFLLYGQASGGTGLAFYTCLVVGGACAIYLHRGWRSLIYLGLIGGWAVLLVVALSADGTSARWGLQFSMVLGWVLLGGTPVVRSWLQTHRQWLPAEVPEPTWLSSLTADQPPGPVIASPGLAYVTTRFLWPGASDLTWAALAAAGALLYGGLYWGLRRNDLHSYAPVHGLVATVLAAYGTSEALNGTALLVAWATEAALLPYLSWRLGDTLLRASGHVLSLLVFIALFGRFLFSDPNSPLLVSPEALSELLALWLLGSLSWQTRSLQLRRLYQAILIAGWFGWWAHNLLTLSQGPSYLLIVGSLSALGLLAVGRWQDLPVFSIAGHVTFGILVGGVELRLLGASEAAMPLLHLPAASELLVLGAGLLATRFLSSPTGRYMYQGAVLLGWLGWTLHELAVLSNGQAYVSVLWGGTAAAQLIGGAWGRRPLVQKSGLAVLALFVGKLFFVDLATLPTLGRIGLFLGTGAGFLAISYLLPGLGGSDSGDS